MVTARRKHESDPIPEDVHIARCVAIYDLGEHEDKVWGGIKHQVLIGWELPALTIKMDEGDIPRMISKRYTLSLGKKSNLLKDLVSWRGREFTKKELEGFEIKKLLGAPCQLQVLHTERNGIIYANISSVIKMPAGLSCPDQVSQESYFSFEEGTDIPPNTPGWIADQIKSSITWKQSVETFDADDADKAPWEEDDAESDTQFDTPF